MDEFGLIRQYFDRGDYPQSVVGLGIGDDAAVLDVPPGYQWVVATDTLVDTVHFPTGAPPHAIGYRALATNLSDLAAMGAEPAAATLALTLPDADSTWLAAFSQGFFELADEFNVALVGGDTTRGPLTVTVAVYGLVPSGKAVQRRGATPGDHVLVTGELGAAGAGLEAYFDSSRTTHERYLYPYPRVAEGLLMRDYASAAIDISDGLVADVGHMTERSVVGCQIREASIPVADGASLEMALSGGDDYELCIAVEPDKLTLLHQHWAAMACPLTDIGVVTARPGVRCLRADGRHRVLDTLGYHHF